jgi:hypothetical protein
MSVNSQFEGAIPQQIRVAVTTFGTVGMVGRKDTSSAELEYYDNTYMSPDYAGDQFVISSVIRALGQPFTLVPLSALATALLLPKDAGDGSAIFQRLANI